MGKIRPFHYLFVFLVLSLLSLPMEMKGNELFPKIGIQPIKNSKKTPNFCLEDLNGKKVELTHFKGKTVFLNFWATWCGPCKEEMPSMEVLYQKFKNKNFVLLSICVDYQGVKRVKEFMEKHRYSFPVLLDPKCTTLDLYGIKGIPTTLIIDKKGTLIGKAVGPKNWDSPDMISLLEQLTAK